MVKYFFSQQFKLTKVIYFHTVLNGEQFYLTMDRILSGATTLGKNRAKSNGYKSVLHNPQISRTVASPSDCLMSYPELGIHLSRDKVGVFHNLGTEVYF